MDALECASQAPFSEEASPEPQNPMKHTDQLFNSMWVTLFWVELVL
jgi:hypothetical protein